MKRIVALVAAFGHCKDEKKKKKKKKKRLELSY